MKKVTVIVLALVMIISLAACGGGNTTPADNNTNNTNNTAPEPTADKDYVIRIYSNSNPPERMRWFMDQANKAGFKISIDDNTVISGDAAAVQWANEKKDGDILFGLNETRWGQIINGTYENLRLVPWTPSWAGNVGDFKYDGKAYGLVIQNVLMLYRTDEYGTNGQELKFEHWADIVDCGYKWYRQGKIGGATNANINSSIPYPFADPSSPAGGISVDGWKTLWKYCAEGSFTGDNYGFEPLNRGEVQVSTYFSGGLYGSIDSASEGSEHPIKNDTWKLVDIADGTYYIAEYLGILDKAGRTEAQTLQVKAFAEWFGGADLQAAWAEEFGTYPCNRDAAAKVYAEVPEIYTIKNFALNKVRGTDMTYAEYVGVHSAEWTNILVNLGFYWADKDAVPAEPDWDALDWADLTQKK